MGEGGGVRECAAALNESLPRVHYGLCDPAGGLFLQLLYLQNGSIGLPSSRLSRGKRATVLKITPTQMILTTTPKNLLQGCLGGSAR